MEIDALKQNLREYIVQRFTVPADDPEFTSLFGACEDAGDGAD